MPGTNIRTMTAALGAVAVALSLSACAPVGHPGAAVTAGPHSSDRATPPASASATPVAVPRLSTTPGDELFTFSGIGHSSDGSTVSISFTVHAPVAWNAASGTATLAALAASGSAQAAVPSHDLRDTTWDAANTASLAVVDYSATMASGSWHPGEQVEVDLGPGLSEVAVTSTGVAVANGWWLLTGPGSGHFVIAYKNYDGSTPDPSKWGDGLQIYGLETPRLSGGTSVSYQFPNCQMDLTPLGHEAAGVAEWFMPTTTYCSAGIGD